MLIPFFYHLREGGIGLSGQFVDESESVHRSFSLVVVGAESK